MPLLPFLLLSLFSCSVSGQSFREAPLPEIVDRRANSMDVRVADLDRDGDPDLVIAVEFLKNVILLNDGKGHFIDGSDRLPDQVDTLNGRPKPWRYYPYHDSEDVAVFDVDHDGLLDLIFVTEDDGYNEFYLQNADGSFADRSADFPVLGITNGLIADDFDGDGWIDLILGNNGQNVYLRNDHGRFVDETADRLPAREEVTQDVETADLDGDGDPDLLVGNESDNYILLNDGKGYFADLPAGRLSEGIGEETREADFGDVDGDGDQDLYFANVRLFTDKAPIQRLLLNEDGIFRDRSTERLRLDPTTGAVDADFHDIDQDGDPDLLLGKMDGLSIALNDGKGFFTEQTEELLPYPIKDMIIDVEVADFNGDGKADIYLGVFRGADRLLLGE